MPKKLTDGQIKGNNMNYLYLVDFGWPNLCEEAFLHGGACSHCGGPIRPDEWVFYTGEFNSVCSACAYALVVENYPSLVVTVHPKWGGEAAERISHYGGMFKTGQALRLWPVEGGTVGHVTICKNRMVVVEGLPLSAYEPGTVEVFASIEALHRAYPVRFVEDKPAIVCIPAGPL